MLLGPSSLLAISRSKRQLSQNIQQHHLSLSLTVYMRSLPDTAFLIKESAFTLSHMLPLLLIYLRDVPPDVKQWCRPQPFLDTSSPPMLSHWIPCHQVALNALRNPPVPNGSGSIEKSTVVGLPVRAITDMSKLKISAEVVVSVMSFPNFSMSTTDRLCGTNLHGIWNDALWGMFPCKCIAGHRFRHTVVLHACFLDVPNRDFVDFVEVFERDCLHLQLHFLGLKVAILTRCFYIKELVHD